MEDFVFGYGGVRGCTQKFPDWVYNEIYIYLRYYSSRSNTNGCGDETTHYTDSQNSDTTASSGRELYLLQFSLQAASPETSGYTPYFCIAKTSLRIETCSSLQMDHRPEADVIIPGPSDVLGPYSRYTSKRAKFKNNCYKASPCFRLSE
jgi:hypothetical protein